MKISVVVPCYNDEKSVEELCTQLVDEFENQLSEFDYEIILADDHSKDQTESVIEKLCSQNRKIKAVFNATNFGFDRNVFSAMTYATGDCAFLIFGDLQDPPEMLTEFVNRWKQGYKCILGQRTGSNEDHVKYRMRKIYYDLMDSIAENQLAKMVNGFGLYDREFLNVLKDIHEVSPFFKSVIAEYGMNICLVPYQQNDSRRGKSNFNLLKNYDFVMHGLTASTKILMRSATFFSLLVGALSIIFAIYVFIRKLINWNSYPFGDASLLVGMFLIGAVLLFFLGIMGEYVLNINERVSQKPRTVVGKKINMDE